MPDFKLWQVLLKGSVEEKEKKKKQGREKHSVMSKAQECGPSNV